MNILGITLLSLVAMSSWGYDSAVADLVFAGDAMQHQAQIDAARQSDGTYDYSGCFDEISTYIKSADYAVVNLETPLGGAPYSGYPCFSAPDAYMHALIDAGFDMMLTANNHTLDRHDRGLLRTLDMLDSARIDHLGTYRSSAERSAVLPLLRDISGFKIAFLNYTYGTNGITLRTDAVVDYIDRQLIASDICAARKAGAEIVVACVHWGEEYRLTPEPSQRSLADFLVGNGVDIVIGGHPHVIQPMEIRDNTAGKRSLVVYSLGNFISNMRTRDTRGGALVRVRLRRDPLGRPIVDGASYRLVFTLPPESGQPGFHLVPVEAADDSQRTDIPSQWADRIREFKRSADGIFHKYNVNVPRDSSRMVPSVVPVPALAPSERLLPLFLPIHEK